MPAPRYLTLPAAVAMLGALAACGEVQNQSFSTVTVNGEAYDIRTRTITQAGRTYTTSSAVVNGITEPCILDSPGDCEAAVRRARNQFDSRDR